MLRLLKPRHAEQRAAADSLRSPLSFETLGERPLSRLALIVFLVVGCGVSFRLRADIVGPEPPTFEERFSESVIVAIARIEAGSIGTFSSQIFKARVAEGFKGIEKDQFVYFHGGNVGFTAYGVGEVYLLMLRKTSKLVGDVLPSFAPATEELYEAVCLNHPILNRRRNPWSGFQAESVFLFGGCADPPLVLYPKHLGQGSLMFSTWVAHDAMVAYLRKLAAEAKAKLRGTA